MALHFSSVSDIKICIDAMEEEYYRMVKTFEDDIEEKNQRIAELEEQIKDIGNNYVR